MGASSIWHTALARKIWANATSLGEALPPNKQGGGKCKALQHGKELMDMLKGVTSWWPAGKERMSCMSKEKRKKNTD